MKKRKFSFCIKKKINKMRSMNENFRMKANLSKTMIEEFLSLLQKQVKIFIFFAWIRLLIDFKVFVDFSKFSNNFETNKKMLINDSMERKNETFIDLCLQAKDSFCLKFLWNWLNKIWNYDIYENSNCFSRDLTSY